MKSRKLLCFIVLLSTLLVCFATCEADRESRLSRNRLVAAVLSGETEAPPPDAPLQGNIIIHVRAERQFQDTGGATAATADGDAVARWDSVVGAGSFQQSTGAQQPEIDDGTGSGASRNFVNFDGSAENLDELTTSLGDNDGTLPMSFVAFVRTPATANNMTYFAKTSAGSTPGWYVSLVIAGNQPLLGVAVNDGSNRARALGSAVSAGLHRIIWTYDGSKTAAGMTLYVDGVLDGGTSVLNPTMTGSSSNSIPMTLGARGGDQFFGNYLGEVILYDIELSAAQVTLVDDYMQEYWGL